MSSYLQYASGYLCNWTEDAFLLQAMVAGMSTDVFLAKGTCSAETSLATLGFHMF